jgi:adenine phosphoribosyltransferase
MIRKKWRLPGATIGVDYSLEYWDNSIEIQSGAVRPGQKVAIIDDLLATGGTLAAAASLVEKVWGKVQSLICLISLDESFLREQAARKSIEARYNTVGILHYDD